TEYIFCHECAAEFVEVIKRHSQEYREQESEDSFDTANADTETAGNANGCFHSIPNDENEINEASIGINQGCSENTLRKEIEMEESSLKRDKYSLVMADRDFEKPSMEPRNRSLPNQTSVQWEQTESIPVICDQIKDSRVHACVGWTESGDSFEKSNNIASLSRPVASNEDLDITFECMIEPNQKTSFGCWPQAEYGFHEPEAENGLSSISNCNIINGGCWSMQPTYDTQRRMDGEICEPHGDLSYLFSEPPISDNGQNSARLNLFSFAQPNFARSRRTLPPRSACIQNGLLPCSGQYLTATSLPSLSPGSSQFRATERAESVPNSSQVTTGLFSMFSGLINAVKSHIPREVNIKLPPQEQRLATQHQKQTTSAYTEIYRPPEVPFSQAPRNYPEERRNLLRPRPPALGSRCLPELPIAKTVPILRKSGDNSGYPYNFLASARDYQTCQDEDDGLIPTAAWPGARVDPSYPYYASTHSKYQQLSLPVEIAAQPSAAIPRYAGQLGYMQTGQSGSCVSALPGWAEWNRPEAYDAIR
ncbi:unnamed protein product, partial [Protopolystoma xenopodis]